MKTYELTYIISPELTIEEAEAKSKEIEGQIQEKEGVITKTEKPVAKTLPYRIKKYGSGFFAILEFRTEPETILELKNKLDKDSQILRHMLLVKNPAKKIKERRQRIKPVVESTIEKSEVKIEEEKPKVKKIRSEKSKEKADIEDIDKKLDEILSE